jgi:hypothetical protein
VAGLNPEKLAPLLRLKYHAIADATQMPGEPQHIRDVFAGFQRYVSRPEWPFVALHVTTRRYRVRLRAGIANRCPNLESRGCSAFFTCGEPALRYPLCGLR